MNTTIQKWGNSLAVRIPASFARQLGIGENETVELELLSGSLRITPKVSRRTHSKRKSLAVYLEGITAGNRHEPVDSGEPVGKEQI